MITVIGMWEQGYSQEQMFLEDTIWKQTLSAFAVDRFIMVRYPGVSLTGVSIPEQYDTMEEALASSIGERVFLTFPAASATDLSAFVHPTEAVYIFGRPADNLLQYIRPQDHRVHIFTPANVDMLACSCVSAVLYSRSIQ